MLALQCLTYLCSIVSAVHHKETPSPCLIHIHYYNRLTGMHRTGFPGVTRSVLQVLVHHELESVTIVVLGIVINAVVTLTVVTAAGD